MGACGCGDFDNVRWAVTVGPFVLAASDYDGCNNGCAAPLGFNLHLMTPEEAARWQIEPTGEWTPGAHGFDTQYLNLFGQDELAEAAKGLVVDLEEYESLADVLDEQGLDLMRSAWKRTRAQEDELRKRFGEKSPFQAHRPIRYHEGRLKV